MTPEDIIRMAREAGFETKRDMVLVAACEITPTLARFAAFVAAAEREACAEIAEHWRCNGAPRHGVAAFIRARSKT
jgi:hypothetical protein